MFTQIARLAQLWQVLRQRDPNRPFDAAAAVLLPCPFCGAEQPRCEYRAGAGTARLVCTGEGCGAAGPEASGHPDQPAAHKEAINRWNWRS